MSTDARPRCVFCGDVALDGHLTCGRLACNESGARQRRDEAFRGTRTDAGHYYASDDAGRLREVPAGTPDVIICRRLEDFPGGVVPAGGGVVLCTRCQRPIVHNPATFPAVPRICMQCGGIEPLPFSA